MLLDLYVAWSNDPSLNIAVYMSRNAYSDETVRSKGKSRYNALNIKVSTIDIVNRLHICGLIGLRDGWQDVTGKGFLTRIWAAEPLTQMFMDAAFGYFDIGYPENKSSVILRDNNKQNIEYEDTAETRRMHNLLRRYNRLLERTFVDIPPLD